MSTHKSNRPKHGSNQTQGARKPLSSKTSGGAAKSSAVKHSAREAALDVLIRVEENQSYSNLLLNQVLQKHALERADAGLATELVYGTIGRKNTIDFFLERFVSKGLAKLEPWVRCLLRLSFYQLHYLDRIPDHAVVSEAVNIAKRRGHQGISGMVNGVLRAIIRSKAELVLPAALGDVKRIALGHSHPEWLVRRWIRQLGPELTEQICAANNEPPHVSIRANARRRSRLELLEQLQGSGLSAEASELAPAGILVQGAGNMALSPGFLQGDFSIQDESSMLVAEALEPRPGMTVLDCCAAPGGKTAHIAEKMDDSGKIWACDLHEHKQKLIADQAERLGLTSIQTLVMDAAKLDEHFGAESFDRILLDAPCSGLGVIRRKPDLKWAKQEAEIDAISELQYAILSRVHRLLRPGGVLVYSTCTIEHAENAGMVERFLAEHRDFELEPLPAEAFASVDPAAAAAGMVQILPQQFHSDGFFIARLRKRA
ncbi:16S rRNA (cytosine(967)-C(5))-methyltransferase RsmB [Paenibacillus sp. MAH-36]|uniref:16S rRNA (cytosine(967)-C(5))-methyltransferase RsmB n=1 Tax=Paenibacillus TaxID=44249 RepID=UPI003606BC87